MIDEKRPVAFVDPIKIRAVVLQPDQQDYILKQFRRNMDLELMVKTMYGDSVDLRDPRADAIKDFIVSYCTPEALKEAATVTLTAEQKAIIDKLYTEDGSGVGDICGILYPDKKTGNFSQEWSVVRKYLEEAHGYEPRGRKTPSVWNIEYAVKKINEYVGTVNLDAKNLSSVQKQCCLGLIGSVKTVRYRETYKSFQSNMERAVFESEFVRATWDKPDLTVDEINMYITVADSYVQILNTKETLNTLNDKLNSKENDSEMTIKLTEAINAKNREKNDTEKRIESLLKSLNGSRVERLEKRGANKANLVAFFEAFKQADERERLMKIAAMQRVHVEKEVERLEQLDEFLARVVGITKFSCI